MLLAILVTIRDFLIAAALAWVGVTVKERARTDAPQCAVEACETARDR